MISEGSYIKIY